MNEKRKHGIVGWWGNVDSGVQALIVWVIMLVVSLTLFLGFVALNQAGIAAYQNNTPCIEQARIRKIDELNAACIIELGLQDAYQRGESK